MSSDPSEPARVQLLIDEFLTRHPQLVELREDLALFLETALEQRGSDGGDTGVPTWIESRAEALPHLGGDASVEEVLASIPRLSGPMASTLKDLGVLARGGVGEIRRVYDSILKRTVVAKYLLDNTDDRALQLARFIDEAQVTAQLQHPGIVPVHGLSRDVDGRVFFTMKEIRGRTLLLIINGVHAVSHDAWGVAHGGWSLRRLVETFRRVCETLAYAHACGVVHRDIKPANIMVGDYGEVLVVDWGLAKVLDASDAPTIAIHLDDLDDDDEEDTGPVTTVRTDAQGFATRDGTVAGTPPYMPPEQASGAMAVLDARADVYALGAVLYKILSGKAPYSGRSWRSLLKAIRKGPPTPIRERNPRLPLPDELVVICDKAMARRPQDRYPDAGDLAEDVGRWLEGAYKRDRALELVAQAEQVAPRVRELRREADRLRGEAARMQLELKPWDAVERKLPMWAVEDLAQRKALEADSEELRFLDLMQGALTHDADLREAHQLLALHHREQHERAAARDDEPAAARHLSLLRQHDRGGQARYLRGVGALTLVSDPLGAEALLFRYELRDRRLVPVPRGSLGPTPVMARELDIGSYLVVLRAEGHADVSYPVLIERERHWEGVLPGSAAPLPIRLPRAGELGPDDVYVPAGWFFAGDGSDASRGRTGPCWVDAFVVRRFPVTNAEMLKMLNDLVARGDEETALRIAPRERVESSREAPLVYGRDEAGRFFLQPDADGDLWQPDWPVVQIDAGQAGAYASVVAQRSGLPWRLPGEYEIEKAGRGADRRSYPWGSFFEPTWCNMNQTWARPRLESVHAFRADEGPYGVRCLAGTVSEWCGDDEETPWRTVYEPPRLRVDSEGRRVMRGGAWVFFPRASHLTNRSLSSASTRMSGLGFRLARCFDVTNP